MYRNSEIHKVKISHDLVIINNSTFHNQPNQSNFIRISLSKIYKQ